MNLITSYLNILGQPLRAARSYSMGKFLGDLQAGVTVGIVAVPQSMAYAVIAGVQPVYGLYSIIVQCLIGSLFNSSQFLSVGPMITQSLLVNSIATVMVAGMPTGDDRDHAFLTTVFALTMLKGIMQLLMSVVRLGSLAQYVSQSVVIAFSSAAGILIGAGQIHNFMGYDTSGKIESSYRVFIENGIPKYTYKLFRDIEGFDWRLLIIGAVALGIVVGCRLISKKLPGPLFAVVVAGLMVFGWGHFAGLDYAAMHLVGEINAVSWRPVLPTFDVNNIGPMVTGAFALALLGVLEPYTISKSLAAQTGEKVDANQELFSQGLTNFVSSFFQCIPGSGSFSRSALNLYAGAKTLYAGVFKALFVAIVLFTLAPLMYYIPMSALAAILFVIGFGLVKWRYFLKILKTSKVDTAVFAVTFMATLFLPLTYAIFIGIFLNLALYLRQSSRLHIRMLKQTPEGPYEELDLKDRKGDHPVTLLSLEGDLFFGVADQLGEQLNHVSASSTRVVILRLKRTHWIDSTVLGEIERFTLAMQQRGGYVILCGLKEETLKPIRGYGLDQVIGEDNLFETSYGIFASVKAALKRAEQLLGASIDTSDVKPDQQDYNSWAYQI